MRNTNTDSYKIRPLPRDVAATDPPGPVLGLMRNASRGHATTATLGISDGQSTLIDLHRAPLQYRQVPVGAEYH